MHIEIINGPNLNLLGQREPHIYGNETFDTILQQLRQRYPQHHIAYFQSNHEGALIDRLQQQDATTGVFILNAGAYTHTSLALADCIRTIRTPVIEVHISNTAAREPIRHTSLIAPACRGTITGFGPDSYRLAIEACERMENKE